MFPNKFRSIFWFSIVNFCCGNNLSGFAHFLETLYIALRPVSTQENKHTLTFYLWITDSNWNRKLVPKAHARFQFCSDSFRSHAYFPEWKSVLRKQRILVSNRQETWIRNSISHFVHLQETLTVCQLFTEYI